jgi:putative ABC transport system permease protein
MLDAVWQDIRYAARSLRRTPAFAAAAVATLALGIGANTAIFSVVNAVLLKPLPYPDSERIVMLVTAAPDGSTPVDTAERFEAWRRHVDGVLEDVSAYRVAGANVTGGTEPEQILSLQVSDDFFRLFGARLHAGRTFTAAEYSGGAARPVLLSHGFWQRRFSGDPSVVGRTISLNGDPHVVVGVLDAASTFETLPLVPTVPGTDLIVPLPPSDDDAPVRYLIGAARLTSNATIAEANVQARQTADGFRREFPTQIDEQDTFRVESLEDTVVGGFRRPLLILLVAVSFVLLIACVNVANLLLIRGSVRQREIAIRTALGASASQIIRRLVVESALLSAIAGSVGLIGGIAAARVLLAINPHYLPRIGAGESAVAVDWRVFLFAALASVVTVLTCSVLPALQVRHTAINAALSERRTGPTRDSRRTRGLLIVAETAVALVLLIGSALLIRTFVALRTVEPGFDSRGVLSVPMTLAGQRFENTAGVAQVVRDGVTRLRNVPGVVQAAAGCCPPMLGRYQLPFIIPTRPLTDASHGLAGWVNISPGYFDVFKMPLIRGRTFTEFDTEGAPGVVVINETMARRFWPDADPLNDRLLIGQGFEPAEEPARQIVGIIGDVRDGGLHGEPVPMMYVPTAQMTDGYTALHARVPMLWFVRTEAELDSVAPNIERELRDASGGVPVVSTMIRSMDQLVSESRGTSDFQTALMTIFACAALLLAAVGVYAVTAYSVRQRTQEIGVRLAMGAQSRHIRHMVLAQEATLTLCGIALGTAAAFGLTRVLSGLLFGVTPHDPVVFVAAPSLLAGVALAAIWLPARRATQIDPVLALRWE